MTISAFPIDDVALESAVLASTSARTLGGKLNDIRHVFDYIPVAQHAAILARTSTYEIDDDIAALIAAMPTLGGAIYFPYGLFNFAETWQVKRRLHITGEGGGQDGSEATTLNFAANKSGIVFHRNNTDFQSGSYVIVAQDNTKRADGSIIEGVHIKGSGADTDKHGVWLKCRTTVREVRISGFGGNGFNVVATSGETDPLLKGNANNWRIDNCRVTACKNGIYVDGADVNAGIALALDCSDCDEWGVLDSAALGNLYLCCHTLGNNSGPYKTESAGSNRSMFLFCYSETGQNASEFAAKTTVIGGTHGADITGDIAPSTDPGTFQFIGNGRLSRFSSAVDASNGLDLNFFFNVNSDEVMSVKADGEDGVVLAGWETTKGAWFRSSGANVLEAFTTDLSAAASSPYKDEIAGTAIATNQRISVDNQWYPSLKTANRYRLLQFESGEDAFASIATAGDATYTAANILTGGIVRDCAGAARADTLPTAALLVAAIKNGVRVGQRIRFKLVNGSDADETITLQAGTGGGWDSNQTAASRVIRFENSKEIVIRLTNVTASSEAYVVYA